MRLSSKDHRTFRRVLNRLEESGELDAGECERLAGLTEPAGFDWSGLARTSFLISLCCGVIAVGAILADDWIREFLEQLFAVSDRIKSLLLFGAGAGVFYAAWRRQRIAPNRIYSTEVINFTGVALVAGGFGFLARSLDEHEGVVSAVLFGATLVYGGIGYLVRSRLIWIFALLALGSWLGAQTGYISGWGAYYLGMSTPPRFVLLGVVLLAGVYFLDKHSKVRGFVIPPSRVMGLLYLFLSLWILSLFGNAFDGDSWVRAGQGELLAWSVGFALAAMAAIWIGLRYDRAVYRGFGLTFLFINLYTKFFEHFWDSTHKAVFFGVLALSFWLIGSRAEAIWELRDLRERIGGGRPEPR